MKGTFMVVGMPSTIVLQPELYESLNNLAHAEGKTVENFVTELLRNSLIEREYRRETERRDGIVDELIAETERLGLYQSDSHS